MRSNACACAVAVGFLLIGGTAKADEFSYSFSGTVTSVQDDPNNLLSANFSVGDAVTGTYTLDTSVADSNADPTLGRYIGAVSFNVTIGASDFSGTAEHRAFNDFGAGVDDIYSIINETGFSGPTFGSLVPETFFLQLFDTDATVFNSDAMVINIPPLSEYESQINGLRMGNPGDPSDFGVIRFSVDSIVPEPICFSFTGTLTSIQDDPSNLLSANFTVGDPVRGSYTLDPSIADSLPADPTLGRYIGAVSFSVQIGSSTFYGTAEHRAFNDFGAGVDDIYSIINETGFPGPTFGSLEPETFFVQLLDTDATVFTTDAMVIDVPPLGEFELQVNGLRLGNPADPSDFGVLRFSVDSVDPSFVCGDTNCDSSFDGADIDTFFLALGDPPAWEAAYPECDLLCVADINQDGFLDGADIDAFFAALGAGECP